MQFYLQRYYKETPTQVFSKEICEVFKTTLFYTTTPVVASEQTHEISVAHCAAKWCSGHLAQVCLSYSISIVKNKNPFDISLFSKLKHAAILLLSYMMDCE